MVHFTPLFIDGQETPASDNATFEVFNTTKSSVVGTSASASSADCKAAVEAAGRAFKAWEKTTPWFRRDLFLKVADLVASDAWRDLIVQTTVEETGCIPGWAWGNWSLLASMLRAAASSANDLTGTTFPSSTGGQCVMERRAMGVVFAIVPWNAPVALALRAIAVPIICGNTVVLKSSEFSPRSHALVVQLFHEAGLPNGVLNYISISRETAGVLTAEVTAHPLVRKINFTGGDRVGRIIATEAAKHLKPVVLELGGNAAAVVLEDASIEDAANAIVYGAMMHSGQICMSTERVIVQRAVADTLVAQIKTLSEKLTVGTEESVNLRPVFTESSAANILAAISEAQAAGAKVVSGDLTRHGALLRPHLVTGVKPGMRLWECESFGPVLAFAVVDTPEEAVELANASEYSLTAALWTSDMSKAQRIAPLIRAGYVNVNGLTVHNEPFIGVAGLGGTSGYGNFHVDDFTDKRVVVTHPLGQQFAFQ
ncbi:Aldehyde/histidinol dehydrogenase [Roridomyces roridus]|uniref:Aldehyde/histidinol dehydrogenase n=1 Tax=Roridomyces roridus TaxID=1738132 RepID=A0AAD7FTT1_9AGAR|nr:Aldehyde/histidinol dehydrogenase [Roridomyces roridus]